MKKIIGMTIIGCCLSLYSLDVALCRTPNPEMLCAKGKYLVYKIDSIGDCYLLYASQGTQRYKIVSTKGTSADTRGRQVRTGRTYRSKLASLQAITPIFHGVYILPMNYMHMTYAHGNENVQIGIDGFGIRTLYYPKNLQGLTLIRHKSTQQGPYGLIDWKQAMKACKKSSTSSSKD